MKICVVTSYTAAAEPRGPVMRLQPRWRFLMPMSVLLDLAACGVPRQAEPELLRPHVIARRTIEFPTRASSLPRLVARKLNTYIGRTGIFLCSACCGKACSAIVRKA